jgi:hypothetical protein
MPLLLLKRGGTCEGDDVRVMTPLLAQPDLLLSVRRLYLVFSFFSPQLSPSNLAILSNQVIAVFSGRHRRVQQRRRPRVALARGPP